MSLGGSSCQQSASQVQAHMEHPTMLRLDFSLKHVYSGCLLAVLSGFVAVTLKHSPISRPVFLLGAWKGGPWLSCRNMPGIRDGILSWGELDKVEAAVHPRHPTFCNAAS